MRLAVVACALALAGCGGHTAAPAPQAHHYDDAFRSGFLGGCKQRLARAGLPAKPCTCLLHESEAAFSESELDRALAARSGPLQRRYAAIVDRCMARSGL